MTLSDAGIENLRETIVMQAVHDLTNAYRYTSKYRDHKVYLKGRLNRLERKLKTKKPGTEEYIKVKHRLDHTSYQYYKIMNYEQIVDECENFFNSTWFGTLCQIDGDAIIAKCKNDAGLMGGKRLRRISKV